MKRGRLAFPRSPKARKAEQMLRILTHNIALPADEIEG
jgi:hypothetical protein